MINPDFQSKIIRQKRQFAIKSTLTAVLAVVIVVFMTLIAYRIPWSYDMTAGRVFTLSGSSVQTMSSLPAPVQIIAIYPKDAADPMISSLLAEYGKASKDLSIEYVDAEREPTKLAQYNLGVSAVSNGTLIVRSSGKMKLLTSADMFRNTSDGNAFWGEREITGAIRYVTATEMPVIYFLEGHEEVSSTGNMSQARSALELDAYNVQTLSLLKAGKVPDDTAALIISSPRKDLSDSETQILDDYLKKGGKAFFLVDAMSTNAVLLSNFNKLLHQFGVDITNNVVVEEDPTSHVGNNTLYLIPGYALHPITQQLAESKRYVILPIAMGLHTLEYNKDEVVLDVLLATTPKSWMRTDMSLTSEERSSGDISGPIPMSYAATRIGSGYGNGDSRVIIIGNSTFTYNNNLDAYANRDFFLNCINWLVGGREEESISPRIIGADKLIVRGNDFIKLIIISLGVLPGIPFIGALLIWYLRRNQ
jgi:ABC-2 type transport system permease protein